MCVFFILLAVGTFNTCNNYMTLITSGWVGRRRNTVSVNALRLGRYGKLKTYIGCTYVCRYLPGSLPT